MASLLRQSNYFAKCNGNHFNKLGYRYLFNAINFQRGHTMIQQGWLYEGDGRRYFVLKGQNLYAFPNKIVWDSAIAQEIFNLEEYDKVKQVSYNNNKFSLESSSNDDKRIFQTETNKEMMSWIRNIRCIQQNAIESKVTFIDTDNKRTPYIQH